MYVWFLRLGMFGLKRRKSWLEYYVCDEMRRYDSKSNDRSFKWTS